MNTEQPLEYFQIHTLLQLWNVQKYVLPEAERLLAESKGELNVAAAQKRLTMVRRIITNLYASCVKAGLQSDADRILQGKRSPLLEAYRRQYFRERLSSR